jgi:flagellar biosynthetic protein FliO
MEAMEQMMAVVVVLALLAATLWWLRRRGLAGMNFAPRHTRRRLESLERLALGPQHVLHLVRFRDRALLVASSPGGCILLEQMPMDGLQETVIAEVRR